MKETTMGGKTGLESCLIELVNDGHIKKCKVFIEKYQRIDSFIYSQDVVKALFEKCKFKDVGNIYDYEDVMQIPEFIDGYNALATDYKLFQRIAVSNKMNSVVFYTIDVYSIKCTFLIDIKHLKKFLKISNKCIIEDSGVNIFRDANFDYENNKYIEIMRSFDRTKEVEVVTRTLTDEHLVFDEGSTITSVMKDISNFFKKETADMFDKLEAPYKRGIILYGDPGNGKSAMIREIIRTLPDVTKVIINPNVSDITVVLTALTKALDGRKAMIVIEDIDSVITDRNRSEFLNCLDGVDIKSGLYFIGTTNYPEKIDPAFMNRCGRFDKTFHIENPSKKTRRKYFKSRNLNKLFSDYNCDNDDVVELFVKYSDNVPMASLKELITGTAYLLANEHMRLKDAIKTSYKSMINSRSEHQKSHNQFIAQQQQGNFLVNRPRPFSNDNSFQCSSTSIADELFEDITDEPVKPKKKVRKIKIKKNKDF